MIKAQVLFVKYFFVFIIESLTKTSGDKEIRTLDPLLARQVLSQLSYIPVGLSHALNRRLCGLFLSRKIVQ